MDRKIVCYLMEKKGVREVRRLLGVGDRRIRKIRALAESYGYLNGNTPLPPYPEALFEDGPDGRASRSSEPDQLLLTRKEWILERLHSGWHPITVFEELGVAASRSSYYRFLHRHGLYKMGAKVRARVVPEIIHQPGEALLLDWGKLRDVLDESTGKKRTLWAFVGVMGYSRLLMVRLVWSNSVAETIPAIESMFRELGGVPSRITSDNPKCFALEASCYEPLLHPVFERLASHYGFLIECLPPADPQKKGKVERPMSYVRRLYEAHGEHWAGIQESQDYINRKISIANERKHGTTQMRPIQQFLEVEAAVLKPLPPLAYSIEEVSEGVVRRDGHVRFDGKYYSCQESFIGKKVMILATLTHVSLYCGGKLIETHERLSRETPWRSKSTKPHHLKPWEQQMQDQSLYRKRARVIGPAVEELVLGILRQGQGFIDTRKIWGILSLDKTYDAHQINEACKQALALNTLSYRTVKALAQLLPGAHKGQRSNEHQSSFPPKTSQSTEPFSHKFARPMSVYEEQLEMNLLQQLKH